MISPPRYKTSRTIFAHKLSGSPGTRLARSRKRKGRPAMLEQAKNFILIAGAAALALMGFMALVRAVLGPRFTDRIIAINVVNTIVVAIITLLSVYLEEDFLVDVALVYALLSFLTVVVLSRMVTFRQKRRKLKSGERSERHGT